MFRTLLTILLASIVSTMTFAQTVVLDFESAETSTTFQSFGGNQEGVVNGSIENPNPSGINTSANVLTYTKGGDAPTWGGAFSNPNPSRNVDFTTTTTVCVKVHMDHIGNVALKFEDSTNGGANWLGIKPNTKMNEWEEICFDVSVPSGEAPADPAAGNVYAKMVFFVDFGTEGTGSDVVTYLDDFIVGKEDVVVEPETGGDIILDFETPETSTDFQSFGGNQEGVVLTAIANPNPSGINTSAMVMPHVKGADAPTWGGAFGNPNPSRQFDFTTADKVCVKVHKDHTGNLTIKFEEGENGAGDWLLEMPTTKIGEWEEICFDTNLPSGEDASIVAKGNVYKKVVFFMDFGSEGTGEDVTSYLDDFKVVKPVVAATDKVILDFEAAETSTDFQSFGGNQEGVVLTPIENPNPSGINTSATVIPHVKAADAPTWGGAFGNPNPSRQFDLVNYDQICVKVHKDHTGNLTIKLEEGENGAGNWLLEMPTTKIGEWEEICFDANLPSGEDASIIAAGNVYNKVVFFMDFGAEGTGEDVTSYLDDFVLKSSSTGGEMVDITFALNTADQSSVESVFVKGTFNDWCEDCTPMSDDDGDGVYTTTVSVDKGAYEYKFVINGSEETLRATMECVKVTDEFVNRLGVFSATTELPPVAFGSCYNVGDGVKMTFRLGFPEDVTPADSIYLAGGGNFDSPGGRFRMTDENGDGIYEITVERLKGFTSDYTFANGNCPGWDCKENIANQDCAVDPFNDRRLPEAVNEDIMISTCFGICSTTANCAGGRVDVGFAVDMKGYEGDFSTVHASGSFNDYCVDCDVLSDNNGDGIYTATISVPTGNMEYHYIVDGVAESFSRGSECGAAGSDSRNTFVIEDKELEATCFNSCYACGQGVKLTIRLGFPAGVEAADEVFIAGGLTFGAPGGRFYLVDDNNDGIYELELERALGFSDYYTFANGNCPGYDCKEDIEGQDCAQADNFNDRWLPELTGDTVIETCYGMCTTSTEECMGVGIDRFSVDNNLFNLVPNFTKDFTKLTFGAATTESKSVKVYDGVGRLVFATELGSNELEYSISTRSFTNGMYFVQVQVGNTLGTQKLMKY